LPRQSGLVSFQNNAVLLVSDAFSVINLFSGPQWGLFTQNGQPAFQTQQTAGIFQTVLNALGPGGQGGGQSVDSVDYSLDYRVSTAPQTNSSFMSYNKVSSPFDGKVTYNVSGTEAQRNTFLGLVRSAEASLTLFDLVMPEITYTSCNVIHHSFRRTAEHGLTMIVVDVWVEEIRVTGTTQFSNTTAPSGANPQSVGQVQPSPVTGTNPGPI
jgi:hypothetical protein